MKDKTSRRTHRIENKKKKLAALVEITKLNEYDRLIKKAHMENTTPEPNPKRQKIEDEQQDKGPPPLINGIDVGPSGKQKIYGEEYQQLKKLLREKTNKMRQQPHLRLRDMGIAASIKMDIDNRVPLFMSDIQHLILYSQLGHHSSYSPSRWCALDKFNRLINTCVFIVENVSLTHFLAHQSMFPFTSSQYEHVLEVLTPHSHNSDIVKELSMVPLTSTQIRKYINKYGNLNKAVLKSNEIFDTVNNLFPMEQTKNEQIINTINNRCLPSTDRFPRTQLLLSGWQMIEENFPLPIKGLMEKKYNGYVLTKDEYEPVTAFSKMFGIDCEMCMTTSGDLELTRVSVVDEDLNIFYDTLVKPDNKITDYLTRFSGITHKMMKDVNKKLKDVQNDLCKLLPKDAILVGQSLCNDLHALKMMHPYVIDTSVIYNITGDRTRKTKLKTLAKEFLSISIQEGKGHCSTEDSSAALKLTKLKLTKNLYFGDAVMGNNVQYETRLYPELGTSNYAISMLNEIIKNNDKTTLIVGIDDITTKYEHYINNNNQNNNQNDNNKSNGVVNINERIKIKSEKNNKDVIKNVCDNIKDNSLTIAHIKIHDNQLESNKTFKNIDKWIKKVYEALSQPALSIVIFEGCNKGNSGCFLHLKKDLN